MCAEASAASSRSSRVAKSSRYTCLKEGTCLGAAPTFSSALEHTRGLTHIEFTLWGHRERRQQASTHNSLARSQSIMHLSAPRRQPA